MPSSVVRIQLEVDSDREPIAGRASDESGRVCAFSNWLTLIAVLEDLRGAGSAPLAEPSVPAT